MNLRELTEEELEQLRVDLLTEQERRYALATIPAQIADLRVKFIEGGGDPEDLENVERPTEPEESPEELVN